MGEQPVIRRRMIEIVRHRAEAQRRDIEQAHVLKASPGLAAALQMHHIGQMRDLVETAVDVFAQGARNCRKHEQREDDSDDDQRRTMAFGMRPHSDRVPA